MIPPHTCTVYCDGKRYCVEPGTHTMEIWSDREENVMRLIANLENCEVLRMDKNQDAVAPQKSYLMHGFNDWHADRQDQHFKAHNKCWLVTVREKG